jgi:hypothetical protein
MLVHSVAKDGQTWRVGTSADVAWINDGTTVGVTISAGIPEVFDAYATLVLPRPIGSRMASDRERQRQHDQVVLALLKRNTPDQPWWLGFLDTGSDDVVFPEAPMVTMYAGWRYVLVEAGPEQAATWRRPCDEIRTAAAGSTVTATATLTPTAQPSSREPVWTSATCIGQASQATWFSKGALPDLMFPADRSWLLSTLWDDDWSCLGGPARLIADVVSHPDLEALPVTPGEDATPPGHKAF